jgi:hypothetical protein
LLDDDGNVVPEPYIPGANAWNNTGDYGLNQGPYTTMGYTDGWSGQPAKGPDYGYQLGPGTFDIAAVQYLYGTVMVWTPPMASACQDGGVDHLRRRPWGRLTRSD